MKRGLCWALSLLLLSGCGRGLPQGRELGDTALMRTMGLDQADVPGQVRVTVSTGRRARGLQGEGEPPVLLWADRPSISAACAAMEHMGDTAVFYGHVEQLLLGEELARNDGIMEGLEYFARDELLGLGTCVWLVRGGTGQQAMEMGEDEGAQQRLTALQEDGQMGTAGMTCTVGRALSDLLEQGSGWLPALYQREDVLLEWGYAVLKEGKLLGWLTGARARGLELLLEHPGGEPVELEDGTVGLLSTGVTCVPVMDGEQVQGLELEIRVIAGMEQPKTLQPDRRKMEGELEQLVQEWVTGTIQQLQGWNADCAGLGRMAGTARPECWKGIRREWEGWFPELEIRVRCTAALTDGEE